MSLSQFPFHWVGSAAQAATSYLYASGVKPCLTPASAPASARTAIVNVSVFDGTKTIPNTTIIIQGTTISSGDQKTGDNIVDGNGGFLMPGLINTHTHASTEDALKKLAYAGVTTGLDMGSYPLANMQKFHDVSAQGMTSLLCSGAAACVGPGFPAIQPGFPKESWINTTEDAKNFVRIRKNEGADYLKIFISLDANGNVQPKQELQQTIIDTAKAAGLSTVTHATTYKAQTVARNVRGKFITHMTVDQALDKGGVSQMLSNSQVAIPTLIMMKLKAENDRLEGKIATYQNANDSVTLLYKSGVPILVGTDSAPIAEGGLVSWGVGIHEELGLLVDAGLSKVDVLRGATSLPAKYFNLTDRGLIKPGLRADLLLLSASPLEDMYNSDTVVQVWTAGTPVR